MDDKQLYYERTYGYNPKQIQDSLKNIENTKKTKARETRNRVVHLKRLGVVLTLSAGLILGPRGLELANDQYSYTLMEGTGGILDTNFNNGNIEQDYDNVKSAIIAVEWMSPEIEISKYQKYNKIENVVNVINNIPGLSIKPEQKAGREGSYRVTKKEKEYNEWIEKNKFSTMKPYRPEKDNNIVQKINNNPDYGIFRTNPQDKYNYPNQKPKGKA